LKFRFSLAVEKYNAAIPEEEEQSQNFEYLINLSCNLYILVE